MAAVLAVLVVATLFGVRALELYLQHPLVSIDGAMQTWVAVKAFAAGEQLGQDFQSYLGITMMLFLLPVFVASGGTLFASTLSATVAVFLGLATTLVVLLSLFRGLSVPARWLLFALLFSLVYFMPLSEPGNSLRPLRWALPFFMFPFVLPLLRRLPQGPLLLRAMGVGVVAGVALLWSNDAGIPAFGSLVVAILLSGPVKRAMLAIAGVLLGAVPTVALIIGLATHGAPFEWFQYNFVAVPADQIWYFGSWGRETRVLAVQDLWLVASGMRWWTVIVFGLLCASLAVAVVRRLRGRGSPAPTAGFVFLGLSTLGVALLPQLGGHITNGYNWGMLLIGLAGPLFVFQRPLIGLRLWRPGRSVLVLGALAVTIGATGLAARQAIIVINASRDTVFLPALGLRVSSAVAEDAAALAQIRAVLDAGGVPQDRRLLATYTSAVDILLGSERPTAYGSIIHALGPDARRRFRAVVADREVAFVSTIQPLYSGWGEWNMRADWPFFAALHRAYVPVASNDQQVLWQRRETGLAASPQTVDCTFAAAGDGRVEVSVAAPVRDMVQLDLQFDTLPARRRSAIMVATESSPYSRNPSVLPWVDAPRYGVALQPDLSLVVPIMPGESSGISLALMDGTPLEAGRCTATLLGWPDLDGLPSFSQFARRFAGGTR